MGQRLLQMLTHSDRRQAVGGVFLTCRGIRLSFIVQQGRKENTVYSFQIARSVSIGNNFKITVANVSFFYDACVTTFAEPQIYYRQVTRRHDTKPILRNFQTYVPTVHPGNYR